MNHRRCETLRFKPFFVLATLLVLSAAAAAAVPSPDTAGHLEVDGSKLYYETYGEAVPGKRPVLVLIHDGVAHREVAAFAADHSMPELCWQASPAPAGW